MLMPPFLRSFLLTATTSLNALFAGEAHAAEAQGTPAKAPADAEDDSWLIQTNPVYAKTPSPS